MDESAGKKRAKIQSEEVPPLLFVGDLVPTESPAMMMF